MKTRRASPHPQRAPDPAWTYSVSLHGRTLERSLPVASLCTLWPALASVGERHGVEPTLMLAIALVETALSDGTREPIRFFPPQVAHRFLATQRFGATLDVDFAAHHLAQQLQRYGHRMPLALLAYHMGPERVAERGARLLDDPDREDFIRAVLSMQCWLREARPWEHWGPILLQPPRASRQRNPRQPPRPPSSQRRLLNLLTELDELVLNGYAQENALDDGAALLKAALPSGWPCLRRFLERLSPDERRLLKLINSSPRLSHHQVAQRMGITLSALRNRLYRLAGRLMKGGFTV